MKPIVHLSKAVCLPIMQKAYRDRKLQAQVDPHAVQCQYSGPCVIGVCLTPEQQIALDEVIPTGISSLIANGLVTTDDDTFFKQAQEYHDDAIKVDRPINRLARHLGVEP